MRIPQKVEEQFQNHQIIAQSNSSTIKMTSYQNAKQNLSILTRIMISHTTCNESRLIKELHDMTMNSLLKNYGRRRCIAPGGSVDPMVEYMREHEELLNHETMYVNIFNKLGNFLKLGYIDKQL